MVQKDLFTDPASLVILDTDTIFNALRQLDRCSSTLTLIVVDGRSKIVGTLTDGDVRRWLLKERRAGEINLSKSVVAEAMCTDPIIAREEESWFQKITEARETERARGCRIRIIPVVDEAGRLVNILDLVITKQRTRLDAVIMAKASLKSTDHDPCKTNDEVERRRAAYDTIRYSTQIAKYNAVAAIVKDKKEFKALKDNRRIDELYSALRRGADWASSVTAPGRALDTQLQDLKKLMADAKRSLLLQYRLEIEGEPHVGWKEAHNKPDFIFVLGCANADEELQRVVSAQSYLQRISLENKWVVLSGGDRGATETEAQRMSAQLSTDVVERLQGRLILEEDSLDTVGNAVLGWLALLKNFKEIGQSPPDLSKTKISIVTSDYHALRTLDLFARVFFSAQVCVHIVSHGGLKDFDSLAINQLDSESRANKETFCLESVATGEAENISNTHVRSMFYQLLRHHDQYRHRHDLVRKYCQVLTEEEPRTW